MASGVGTQMMNCRKTDTIFLSAKLTGGGGGLTCTVSDPVPANSEVVSCTFVSTGLYDLVFRTSYPQLLSVFDPGIIGTTVGLDGNFVSFDAVAKTARMRLAVGNTLTDAAITDVIYLNWVVRNSGKNQ